MPPHHRSRLSAVGFLFALCILGCQQKPWMEHRKITNAQRKEREKIMMPIIHGLVEDERSVFHAPNVEGKPASNYQRLLDLADRVRHDPVNRETKYFYLEFFNTPLEMNQEDEYIHRFTIVVREKHIESAELPPPMDL